MSLPGGAGFKPVAGGAPAVLLRTCACVTHLLAFAPVPTQPQVQARKQGGAGKSEAARGI
jgi:hypothetical protein